MENSDKMDWVRLHLANLRVEVEKLRDATGSLADRIENMSAALSEPPSELSPSPDPPRHGADTMAAALRVLDEGRSVYYVCPGVSGRPEFEMFYKRYRASRALYHEGRTHYQKEGDTEFVVGNPERSNVRIRFGSRREFLMADRESRRGYAVIFDAQLSREVSESDYAELMRLRVAASIGDDTKTVRADEGV